MHPNTWVLHYIATNVSILLIALKDLNCTKDLCMKEYAVHVNNVTVLIKFHTCNQCKNTTYHQSSHSFHKNSFRHWISMQTLWIYCSYIDLSTFRNYMKPYMKALNIFLINDEYATGSKKCLKVHIKSKHFFSGSGSWLFFKRLRLLIFFPSGSCSWYFFSSSSGSKGPKAPSSDRLWLRLLGKIFFSPQTSKVKLQKKYKTSEIIVFLTF